MRRWRWLCRVLASRPRVYRVQDLIREPPRYDGGSDWLGLRFGPLWIEWAVTTDQ